jgi:hypothetical protein
MAPRPVMFVGYLTYTDEPSVPGQPPYPSTGPGFPTHPIAPGGGGQPPYPSQGPGFPTHPIAGYPWPQPPYPSQGPGFPTHPIHLPPSQPPGIWGPTDPRPSHPIVIPPDQLPPSAGIGGGSGAAPIQPIAGMPVAGGVFLAYNIPGYGVMLKPTEGYAALIEQLPHPSHPITMPTPEPKS